MNLKTLRQPYFSLKKTKKGLLNEDLYDELTLFQPSDANSDHLSSYVQANLGSIKRREFSEIPEAEESKEVTSCQETPYASRISSKHKEIKKLPLLNSKFLEELA